MVGCKIHMNFQSIMLEEQSCIQNHKSMSVPGLNRSFKILFSRGEGVDTVGNLQHGHQIKIQEMDQKN